MSNDNNRVLFENIKHRLTDLELTKIRRIQDNLKQKQARQVQRPDKLLHFSTIGDARPKAEVSRQIFGLGQRKVSLEDIEDSLSSRALERIQRETNRLRSEVAMGTTEVVPIQDQNCTMRTDTMIEKVLEGQCTVGLCRVYSTLYFDQVSPRNMEDTDGYLTPLNPLSVRPLVR